MIAKAIAANALDGRGSPPTDRTMRETWRKACAHVEAGRGHPEARPKRKLQPRDLPRDWRPAEVLPGDSRPAPRVLPRLSSGGVAAGPPPVVEDDGGLRLKPGADGKVLGSVVTHGAYLPEPDYTGMTRAERIIARQKWMFAKERF